MFGSTILEEKVEEQIGFSMPQHGSLFSIPSIVVNGWMLKDSRVLFAQRKRECDRGAVSAFAASDRIHGGDGVQRAEWQRTVAHIIGIGFSICLMSTK